MPVIKSHSAPATAEFSMHDIEREAVTVLEAARRRAGAILQHAREEAAAERDHVLEEARRDGLARGHAEGYEQGVAAGREEARVEHSARLGELSIALESLLRTFDADREALAGRAADEVVTLALAIAERICKRAGMFDRRVCADNAAAALRLVMRAHDVKLHVHPADLDNLSALLPEVQRRWPSLKHVTLHADAALTRGGCRVFTEGGLVDADLQSQLDRIAADLVPGKDGDEG